MATKLIAVVVTVLLTSCKGKDSICSEFQDNCSPDENLCLIECSKDDDGASGATPCVPDANCPTFTPSPPTFEEMNGEFCKQTCVTDTNDIGCAFYRYELIEPTTTKMCYLMSADQCADMGDGCDTPCESGAAKCDGGGLVVDPEEYNCPSGTPHIPGTIPNFNLHWNCRDVNNHNEVFDITKEGTAPGKTVCTAKPDCEKNGLKQNYVYTCAEDPEDATTGEWQWVDLDDGTTDPEWVVTDADNEPDNLGKLKEATCNADPLPLSNYEDQINHGMEILCVGKPIDENTVPAQNSCILICDGYPILNFYTKMTKWIYTMMDEPNNEIDIPSDPTGVIFCHI